jgi:hypothetical protein
MEVAVKIVARIALIAVTSVLAIGTSTASAWYTYFGPEGTFYQAYLGGPTLAVTSGWNYHTNNRVYRPSGHPFVLWYMPDDWNPHWSTTNWSTNPFYFGAYGYNRVGCDWEYYNDGSTGVYPVTCQADT